MLGQFSGTMTQVPLAPHWPVAPSIKPPAQKEKLQLGASQQISEVAELLDGQQRCSAGAHASVGGGLGTVGARVGTAVVGDPVGAFVGATEKQAPSLRHP